MEFPIISQYITTCAAFLGIGLGLYNLYIASSNRRVKIKVVPKSIIRKAQNKITGEEIVISSKEEFNPVYGKFMLEIVNLSNFSVTIDNVGFKIFGDKGQLSIAQPILYDGGRWPRRLESRESFTVYCSLDYLLNNPKSINIKNAFAETSCGSICKGSSKALKQLVEFIKKEKK